MKERIRQKSNDKEIMNTRSKGKSPSSPRHQRKVAKSPKHSDSDEEYDDDEGQDNSSNLYPSLEGLNDSASSSGRSRLASRSPSHSPPSDASPRGKRNIKGKEKLYPSTEDLKSDGDKHVGGRVHRENLKEQRSGLEASAVDKAQVKKEKGKESSLLIWVGILVALMAIFGYLGSSPSEPTPEVPTVDRFINNISSLTEKFPGQNKRLWRTVKASVLHVLNETDSRYPVVILMASNTQNSQVASCVARKIASHFQSAQNLSPHKFDTADIGDFQQLDPAKQKEELDKKMNNAFGYYKQKAFIIENLQLLSPEAALMLHAYCDNDGAPFKDVMIVLMLHIDENVVKIIGPQSANAIENHLENLWSKGLHIDKVKAMMSRVANNIVVIEKENDATLKEFCP